ncbi:restriction endonuclease subunit S [Candidatus Cetobacterium colombiensis]|uniref:Restriction endonuclease subunit S n=1 Tax=Candidatus Cetobacterium colombiensis TaxID=3073100 RepID=A0ABU4WEC4_9FUSO|nr:restriction endonuclease subunit S [Candidatus Cetobacterium colombiensis]MDX8337342.1 restriction endonuclease subunit S [Candidatus Cetobacterium colombiensis]
MKNKVPKLRFPEFSGEWEEKKLGEISEISSGLTPLRSEKKYFENGEIPWIKTTDLNNGNILKSEELITTYALEKTTLKLLPKNTVLIAMYGGFNQIGRTGITQIETTINQAISALILKKNYSSHYILQYLNGFKEKWKQVAASSRKDPNITKKDVENFKISISSLPEQEKIASFLSKVDESIEILEEEKELWKKYKKGMIQKIFSQKLRFKDENGNDYPEWEESNLEKIAEVNPKTEAVPERFIYIDLESVENGLLKNEKIVLKNEAPSRAQRVLKSNDILYQTVRPYQKNNFYFENTNKIYPFVASTGYAQIRTSQNSKYLYHFLHTDKFVDSVLERCTGTSYPAINSSDLKLIKFNLPSLPEQEKIANFLSSIDEKIELIEKELEGIKGVPSGKRGITTLRIFLTIYDPFIFNA